MSVTRYRFWKKEPKSEVDILIEFLKNEANAEYVPDMYKNDLEKALLMVQNKDEGYILTDQTEKFSGLVEATKYGVQTVGFSVHLTDSPDYKKMLGVSSLIKKLYEIEDGSKIRVGPLNLEPKEEKELDPLGLKMYKCDAKMVFSPERVEKAKEGVIEPEKIKLSVIPPVKVEEKKKIMPGEIGQQLKLCLQPGAEKREKKKNVRMKGQ